MLPYRQGVGLENASFHCRHSTKRISAVLSSTSRSKLRKPTHRRFYNFSIRQNTKRMLSLVFTPSDSLCQVFKHQKIALPPELIRGCSHIMSAKNRGSYTPPPPSVSNGQHLAYPPSPPRQPSSAFSRRPYCTTIFDVDFLT